MKNNNLVILSGNSNPELCREICDNLKTTPGRVEVGRFPEGEIRVQIQQNIRGRDVFVMQSTSTPPNEHLMELLILKVCGEQLKSYGFLNGILMERMLSISRCMLEKSIMKELNMELFLVLK